MKLLEQGVAETRSKNIHAKETYWEHLENE